MEEMTLKVGGMHCEGCCRSVTRLLEAAPGVAEVRVDLARGEAWLRLDAAAASRAQLCALVQEAGYEAA